jgi:hypothetical protein
MKVGDLVKVDFKGWTISTDVLDTNFAKVVHGIIIDLFVREYDKADFIVVRTTEGKHKIYPTNPQLPPNITVISDRDH